MDPDDILTDKDGTKYSYEGIATGQWLRGKYDGTEGVVHYLKKKAGDCFAAGNDGMAQTLRTLANEIIKEISVPIQRNCNQWVSEHPEKI